MITLLRIDKRAKFLFAFVCLFLFFIPKITIIPLGTYEGAGIRLDDFMLLGPLVSILVTIALAKSFIVSPFETRFLLLIAIFMLAYLVNLPFDRGSFFYVVRFVEYFIFFYAGSMLASPQKLARILVGWSILNCTVSLLQIAGLIGGTVNGVFATGLERATGLANNATEASMVCLLIFVFYGSLHNRRKDLLGITALFVISAISIELSASRMPIALLFATYFWFLWRSRPVFKIFMSISALMLLLGLFQYDFIQGRPGDLEGASAQSFQARASSLFKSGSIEAAAALMGRVQYEKAGFSNRDVVIAREYNKSQIYGGADLSLLLRLAKWTYAAKSFANQPPGYWIFGLGPGVWQNALDGGLLRLFTEAGLLGFIVFISLYFCRPRVQGFDPSRLLIIVFFLGNTLIDHYLFYKVMACFLLIIGACAAEVHRRREAQATGESIGSPALRGAQ